MADSENAPLAAPENWAEPQQPPAVDTKRLDALFAAKNAGGAQGGLFSDINELRNVDRGGENDENAKYKDSFFGRLAGNNNFQTLTFAFIGANSLYIGIDADYSARTGKPDDLWDKNTPIGFLLMENLFCVYFTGEVVIRFIAYKNKCDSIKDAWFVFDFILVAMMVLETWIFPIFGLGGQLAQLSVLRLLRLLRISRMARLMKKVPELMIIIKGLIASVRSVGCTAILQVLILYVWSILFVSEYHYSVDAPEDEDDGEKIESFFGTMGKSMFSLFIYGTILDDVTYCADAIRGTGKMFHLALFILFILISSFTILNMLIGILCEVVSATADSEKTKAAETCVKDAITQLFTTLDSDNSGNITEDEFMKMRDDTSVKEALEDMDIHDSHFARYCEILFGQQEQASGKDPTIDFETLINMILRLSPGNHINALDFSLLQASIDRTQENLRDRIVKIHKLIQSSASKTGIVLPQARSLALAEVAEKEAEESSNDVQQRAQSDLPPVPPLTSSSPNSKSMPPKEYSMEDFTRTSSNQILAELERRLGVSAAAP